MQSLVHGMGRILAYFYSLVPSYGIAIIMLTILVRILMIPLAIKQARSMQANRGNAERMRKLQPEVKRIREKYKDDRQRQYEEQRKLYEEHGVNMLGGLAGCLPLLLQTPVFMAMYAVLNGCDSRFLIGGNCVPGFHIPRESPLYEAIVNHTSTFLGTNLGDSPSAVYANVGLLAAWPYLVLIAIMGATMWWQTQMMMKAQPAMDPQMAQTQKIMKFLPLVLVFASWSFPAGLTVYWSASNLWTIGQQWVLLKKYGGTLPEAPAKKGRAGLLDRVAKAAMPAQADPTDDQAPGDKKLGRGPENQKPKSGSESGTKSAGSKPAGKPKGGAGGATGTQGPPRRPAARGARPGSSGQGQQRSSTAKPVPEKKTAQGSGTGSGAAKPQGARPSAGRPKGSGARKGKKGGRR